MASSGYLRNIIGGQPTDRPQVGVLAFGAIVGTTASNATTVLTCSRDQFRLKVINTTNVDLVITVRAPGTTAADAVDFDIYSPATSVIEDLAADLSKLNSGTVVAVYYRSGAPASGEVRVSAY